MRRVKIVIPILKNCLVIFERFKQYISCLELNTVEKYGPREGFFEVTRDESLQCVLSPHGPAFLCFERKQTKKR